MPTTVRFIDRYTDRRIDIPGTLLPCVLPAGLSIRHQTGNEIRLQAKEPATAFAGRLPIPTLTRGQVRVFGLTIPPPSPWHWGALRTMHASVRRLELDPSHSGDSSRRAPSELEHSPHDLEWTALSWCSATAAAALSHWPTQHVRREVTYPLELPRGAELIEATERRLGIEVGLLRGRSNRLAPSATVRRVGTVESWRSRLLAAVASQVCRTLRSVEGRRSFGTTPEPLIRPIRTLAQRSRPTASVADPPFSSWPPVLSSAYAAALAVLAIAAEGGRETGWVPLSDIWRIYEMWLAERTQAILCRILGPPVRASDENRVSLTWQGTNWLLEMRHPCTFTQNPKTIAGREWQSVSSSLEPDIVLVADGPKGPGLVVLDAKAHSDKLSAGYLAQESSKYLWGIRRDGMSIRGVTAVVLVTPKGGDEPFNRTVAAQWTIHAHPHAARDAHPGTVGTDLDSDFLKQLLVDQLGLPV